MVPYLNTKDLEMIRIPKKGGIEKTIQNFFQNLKSKFPDWKATHEL